MPNTSGGRAAAESALLTYMSIPGFDKNDRAESLRDLMVDLAHLSDTFTGDDEQSGGFALEDALDLYSEEVRNPSYGALRKFTVADRTYVQLAAPIISGYFPHEHSERLEQA